MSKIDFHTVYPLTFDLIGRRAARFSDALERLETGVAAQTMAQVRFKELKDEINRAIDGAISKLRDTEYYPALRAASMTAHRIMHEFDYAADTVCLYVHLIPGKLASAQKQRAKLGPNDFAYAGKLIALLTELSPISEKIAFLQGDKRRGIESKLTKREVKPVEEQTPGYHPPKASTAGQKLVLNLLESVTERAYNDMVAMTVERYRGYLRQYTDYVTKIAPKEARVASCFLDREYPHHAAYNVVSRIVVSAERQDTPRSNAEALIQQMAIKGVDELRTAFVTKNFSKIVSIIDAKGNLTHGEEVGYEASLSGWRGRFRFMFADKSRFEVENSVVFVVNSHHTEFNRFPLTFHAVVMPDGTKMQRPSEERMNTVFAKA